MELEIKGKTYPLKATFAFLRKIDTKDKLTGSDGTAVETGTGLAKAIVMLRELSDLECLVDLILALNTKQSPELKRDVLESWLEDECEDPEALADEVIDFLSKANVCKGKLQKMGILTDKNHKAYRA